VGEKSYLRPFVFKMFSALDTMSEGGHKVVTPFGFFEASKAAS